MPFRWTINPYRGCSHACVYCFARNTHTYLDLDAGLDFDSKIVVKVNAAECLRRELAARTCAGEHIAMGTNVDPYQRAEGRYRLMPGILEALRDAANPFSILTKGSLILRDLPLLAQCAEVTDVGANVSVGSTQRDLWRTVEPGTPSPPEAARSVPPVDRRGRVVRGADGTDHPVPVGRRAAAGGHRRGDRRCGSGARVPDRAPPSAGSARMVHGVASGTSFQPGRSIRTALPGRLVRAEGLPGADLGDGARACPQVRRRPRGTDERATRTRPPSTKS